MSAKPCDHRGPGDNWPESPWGHGVARSGTTIWGLALTPELSEPGHGTGSVASGPEGLSLQAAQVPSHLQGPRALPRETQAGLWLQPCPKSAHCPHLGNETAAPPSTLSQGHSQGRMEAQCNLGRGPAPVGILWDPAEPVLLAGQRPQLPSLQPVGQGVSLPGQINMEASLPSSPCGPPPRRGPTCHPQI